MRCIRVPVWEMLQKSILDSKIFHISKKPTLHDIDFTKC